MMKTIPWRRIAVTIAAVLLVLLVAASFRFLQSRGLFASVEDKTPGTCRSVGGIGSVAAIAIDPLGVFVAAPDGGLYSYGGGKAVKLSGTPSDFHPLAMAAAGPKLQVVYTRKDGSYAISLFDIRPGKVIETGRLTTDRLTNPVDLAAIDGTRFYFVNRYGSTTAFGRWLEDAFLLPRAEILYFDGMKFVSVAQSLNRPSALALSLDQSRLYVGQSWMRNLAGFGRNSFMGSLDDAVLRDLSAAPRKITIGKDGSLIVAAVPKAGQGAVYRVAVNGGAMGEPELLYGTTSGEVTAAAEVNGHLLVGSDMRLLDCKY